VPRDRTGDVDATAPFAGASEPPLGFGEVLRGLAVDWADRQLARQGRARRVAALLGVIVVGAVLLGVLAGPVASSGPTPDPDLPLATSDGGGPDASLPPPVIDPPTATVVVHVVGAVVAPGVWEVPANGRVRDAVDAAGGARPDADLDRINLASPVIDGSRLYVPVRGEDAPPAVVGSVTAPAPGSAPDAPTGSGGAPISLNAASVAELESLPGVGPATAAAIVDHRTRNGPFMSVEGLLEVRGIGTAKLDGLRDRVVL
jgi:competence protein ComEA